MATITFRIRELLAEREQHQQRRVRLVEISEATGIPVSELEAMINNRTDHVSLRFLASLCDYFKCLPGDLLLYHASEAPLALDAREIVERWEDQYGRDEYPRS